MIQKDNTGLSVVILQAQLRSLGFKNKRIDGKFDAMTQSAVKDFQRSQGLIIDGIVGPNTNAIIRDLTKDKHLFTFIHCSATPDGRDVSANTVLRYHTINKGWSRPGYSDIFELDGSLHNIRPYNSDNLIQRWEYTFGVKGSTMMNRNSRHVCYIGGIDAYGEPKDTRTVKQKLNLETYIKYEIMRNPNVLILGHNQVQYKACPSFNVPEWMYSIGCSDHNYMHEKYQI